MIKLGSKSLGAIILFIAFAILLYLELIPFLFGGGGGGPPPTEAYVGMPPQERFTYFGMQFGGLPAWAKVWMSFQDIIMGASLFFVLWRKEAQVYALCFILSHIFIFVGVASVPFELLTLNLAAFSHWFWIPALVVLVKAWPALDKQSGYGAWVTVAIGQLVFSLLLDIPDGFRFLGSLL